LGCSFEVCYALLGPLLLPSQQLIFERVEAESSVHELQVIQQMVAVPVSMADKASRQPQPL
jgi:hypothetical protein